MGEHALHCQKCSYAFFINPKYNVSVLVINKEGEFVLVRRNRNPYKDLLDVPGGFVDKGETAEQAAIREIKEELNLELSAIKYFGSYPEEYEYKGVIVDVLTALYIAKEIDTANVKADDDAAEIVFLKPENINYDDIGFPSMKKFLKDFVNNRN
jgi:ADP-ribose pyrophosphatase YjhB (NUDIX family)